jgi:hypothetical protein
MDDLGLILRIWSAKRKIRNKCTILMVQYDML